MNSLYTRDIELGPLALSSISLVVIEGYFFPLKRKEVPQERKRLGYFWSLYSGVEAPLGGRLLLHIKEQK